MAGWIAPLRRFLTASGIDGIKERAALRDLSRWRIGGTARFVVVPRSVEQLVRLHRYLSGEGIPFAVLGHCSNVLICDEGVEGVIVLLRDGLSALDVAGDRMWAECGVSAPRLARAALLHGLTGVEHIVGIPGSIGGLVYMNGGSLRRAIGEVVESVDVLDRNGNVRRLRGAECGFAYRKSVFQKEGGVILKVRLKLAGGERKAIRRRMLEIMQDRRRRLPLREPSCGSVFLSTPENYARYGAPGRIVELLGFKGMTLGGAQVSQVHANFIVNKGGARAVDVLALVRKIQEAARHRLGIRLPCEIRYLRRDCTLAQLGG